MALKHTMSKLKTLLENIGEDLQKAEKGNKTAAQRVRTQSIEFAKIAKLYRKESIATEKKDSKEKPRKSKKKKR